MHSKLHVWALWPSCETLAAHWTGPPAPAQDGSENSKRPFSRPWRFKHPRESPREDPREGEHKRNNGERQENKRENLGRPSFGPPPFPGPTLFTKEEKTKTGHRAGKMRPPSNAEGDLLPANPLSWIFLAHLMAAPTGQRDFEIVQNLLGHTGGTKPLSGRTSVTCLCHTHPFCIARMKEDSSILRLVLTVIARRRRLGNCVPLWRGTVALPNQTANLWHQRWIPVLYCISQLAIALAQPGCKILDVGGGNWRNIFETVNPRRCPSSLTFSWNMDRGGRTQCIALRDQSIDLCMKL